MVAASFLSVAGGPISLVDQVRLLILLIIVTLVVALLSRRLRLPYTLLLGLPAELAQRNLLTNIVYGIILVTLLGQGMTLRALLPRWKEKLARAEEGAS